ncbi:MAG: PilT/PilU family type 4a pilus ATPase [Betaproteobacteria bacterium]|nr:PilT/PilU family type 4a pilus ATPase [Betaproteobacteria bacterium]
MSQTARIDAFLQLGREQNASDIHLAVGMPPVLRMHGEIQPVRYRSLSADECRSLIFEILSAEQRSQFEAGHDLDFSYAPAEGERYRFNVFRKLGGIAAVARIVPKAVSTLDELGLPPVVKKLAQAHQGMLLVTGATGTGKSTTLGAIIDYLNTTRKLNIITLEDPVEFMHRSKMSLVVQREVGSSVGSFAEGLRAALREDPDVILVGELRDPETIAMAMMAAETGHLVLGTLHTTSAAKTLDRIIDSLPAEQKAQGLMFLSQNLRGVVSQVLVKKPDGRGRKAIVEVMVLTPAISNLLLTGKQFQIPAAMQTGKANGMCLLDQALLEAIQAKEVDPDDAYLHANDKKLFQRFVTDKRLVPQVTLVR